MTEIKQTILITWKQWLLCVSLLFTDPVLPGAGIPVRAHEARDPKHEVDTAALHYLPPTNRNLHACYCPPIIWHTYTPTTARAVNPLERSELYVSIQIRATLLCGKTWISHVFWLLHVMRFWPLPCVRFLILLLCRNHTETGLWSMWMRATWGGHCIIFFICTSITMWIEFSCSSEVLEVESDTLNFLIEFIKQCELK